MMRFLLRGILIGLALLDLIRRRRPLPPADMDAYLGPDDRASRRP